MSKKHVNVIIATPGRSMEAEYVKSLVSTIEYLNDNSISFIYSNEYSSQVAAAREATAMGSRFLDPFNSNLLSGSVTYDKVIWIDSDISWTPEDFMKIYNSDKDIVSGLYFNEEGTPMCSFLQSNNIDHQILLDDMKSGKTIEIDSAGFGFIAVKSGVFEKMPRPWFATKFSKIKSDDGTKEFFVPYGEDFSWCKTAQESGFKLFLDSSVTVGHHKKVKIGG